MPSDTDSLYFTSFGMAGKLIIAPYALGRSLYNKRAASYTGTAGTGSARSDTMLYVMAAANIGLTGYLLGMSNIPLPMDNQATWYPYAFSGVVQVGAGLGSKLIAGTSSSS